MNFEYEVFNHLLTGPILLQGILANVTLKFFFTFLLSSSIKNLATSLKCQLWKCQIYWGMKDILAKTKNMALHQNLKFSVTIKEGKVAIDPQLLFQRFLLASRNNDSEIRCVKSVQIRSFFSSEYRKIQNIKNSVLGHFSRSDLY